MVAVPATARTRARPGADWQARRSTPKRTARCRIESERCSTTGTAPPRRAEPQQPRRPISARASSLPFALGSPSRTQPRNEWQDGLIDDALIDGADLLPRDAPPPDADKGLGAAIDAPPEHHASVACRARPPEQAC